MKKAILTFLIIGVTTLVFNSSCKTKNEDKITNQFSIKGKIEGLYSHLYYRHPDKEYARGSKLDSIIVTDGKFEWTDSISELAMIRMSTNFFAEKNNLFKKPDGGGMFPVKSMYLMFFAFPGANVEVSGKAIDYMNAYPSGDEHNDGLASINRMAFPKYNEVVNLMVDHSFERDTIKAMEIEENANLIDSLGTLERIDYITANKNSLAAIWYLEDMLMRRQIEDKEAIEIFNTISEEYHGYEIYKNLETRINGIITTKEGSPVPSIKTMSTLDGQEFDITSLRGKYILIDFWGTWCGPCIEEMPTVKDFQEKHRDNLLVLGINSGDKKAKIQEFVDKHNYDWQHLLSERGTTSDNFVTRFNVQGFPTKFIIDPDGKIVKRYVGSGEEAFELLEELLQ